MPDIYHDFPINSSLQKVFAAVSTAEGLNNWWTKTCDGTPAEGEEYKLGFGAEYEWRAVVTTCIPESEFELRLIKADSDWQNSRLSFSLTQQNGTTNVKFQHLDWPEANEHYRISCFCWAMYLRLLKRYVEAGETVPYEVRLDV